MTFHAPVVIPLLKIENQIGINSSKADIWIGGKLIVNTHASIKKLPEVCNFGRLEIIDGLIVYCQSFKDMGKATIANKSSELTALKNSDDDFKMKFEYKTFDRKKNIDLSVLPTPFHPAPHSTTSKTHFKNHSVETTALYALTNGETNYRSNPNVHNRDQIKKAIRDACAELNIEFVDFEIYAKTMSYVDPESKKRIRLFAIHISCPKNNAGAVKTLLNSCYEEDDIFLPGKFIPNDIPASKTNNPYMKYLKLQNKYLVDHRSIRVSGVHPSTIESVLDIQRPTTLTSMVGASTWIEWMSLATHVEKSGKIIFSTTASLYEGAMHWIKNTFLPYHNAIKNKPMPPEFDGDHATVQTRFGGNHENSLIDGYTESLVADVSNLSDETYTVPPVNAWSKPLAIVATKEATTTTSEQASTITNTNTNTNTASDITALTTMVEQLRSDMKEQMKLQQEMIESIIDNAINTKLAAIDQRYQNILEKVNKRWEDALTKQLEKAERDIDTTVDKVIA